MITVSVLIFATMLVPVGAFMIIQAVTKSRLVAGFVSGMVFLLIIATLAAVVTVQGTAGAPQLP